MMSKADNIVKNIQNLADTVYRRFENWFNDISFTSMLMLNLIVMLFLSTFWVGFVMGKDAERNIGFRAADDITEMTAHANDFFESGYTSALEVLKLVRAPNVVGMKEKKAVTKLEDGDVDPKQIEIKHKKITYSALVKESDTLFFGEVEKQKVNTDGITLEIFSADTSDPFTVQMNAMGSRLAWPLPGHERISSHFGPRSSPGGIGSTNHQGIDIPAPSGSQIIAVKSGKVESAGRMGGYGNCVVIDHENGFKSLYAHMSTITCNVGDRVKPSDVIGRVGSTGWATGSHLHFGLYKDGHLINPEPFFTGKEDVKAGDEVSVNDTGTDDSDASSSSQTTTKNKDNKETTKATKDKKNKTESTSGTKKKVDSTKKTTNTPANTKPEKPATEPETEHVEPTETTAGGSEGE